MAVTRSNTNNTASSIGTVAAWAGNVLSSVAIVFANKILMGAHKFQFATTLTALHFSMCAVFMRAIQGATKKASLPLIDLVIFTIIANASIVALNLSLQFNSVSIYQVAKLLIIPCTCFIEYVHSGIVPSLKALGAIIVVIAGVAIVTVEDLQFSTSFLGLTLAGLSIITSSSQQVMVRSMQKKHNLTPHQLLSTTAPAQALSLLAVGPFLDEALTGKWVLNFPWNNAALIALTTSCTLAVVVNLSQYLCLGKLSAVSFQVLGHAKTVLVLLGGWLVLNEQATEKKLIGVVLAVGGMIIYSQVAQGGDSKAKTAKKPAAKRR